MGRIKDLRGMLAARRTARRTARSAPRGAGPHVLIIVQNLPVPLDRRVWLECQALAPRGYQVSVICPKGPGDPAREVIDGVHLYKYRPPPEANGLAGYVLEFAYCWLRTAWLSRSVWRDHPFDVLQACNPPDTYWLLARWWRRRGVRFLFDHHDLNPELFLSRFGEPTGLRERAELWALRWLERRTFAAADKVTSTNESYRRVALERGGLDPADVTVVRSGPDTRRMRPVVPTPTVPEGKETFTAGLRGDHGSPGRRGHGAARDGRAGAPARTPGRARGADGLRRLPGGPATRECGAAAGPRRGVHRPGRPAGDGRTPEQRRTWVCAPT